MILAMHPASSSLLPFLARLLTVQLDHTDKQELSFWMLALLPVWYQACLPIPMSQTVDGGFRHIHTFSLEN